MFDQGIIGNDGRYYILDLLRTFPPDVNFLPGMVPVNDPYILNKIMYSHVLEF